MLKDFRGVLLLLNIGLVGLVLFQLSILDRHWEPAEPIEPSIAIAEAVHAMVALDAIALVNTVERPLFWPSRRPPVEEEAPPPPPPPPPENPLKDARLVGLYHLGDGGGVLLEVRKGQPAERVMIGERVGHMQLRDIGDMSATFVPRGGGEPVTLPLEHREQNPVAEQVERNPRHGDEQAETEARSR